MKTTGHLSVKEPFAGLFTQGMVVHETYRGADGTWRTPGEIRIDATPDGRKAFSLSDGSPVEIGAIEKMSKSKRNTVDPDEIIGGYGADTARWFMLSDSPPDRDVIWSEEGVQGASRYVQQIWRLVHEMRELSEGAAMPSGSLDERATAVRKIVHGHLMKVEEHIERLRFNTAIAEIRKMTNALSASIAAITSPDQINADLRQAYREALDVMIQMFAPMMPHLAEECWAAAGHDNLVSEAAWPKLDRALAADDRIVIPVQVNGKKRAELEIEHDADATRVEAEALKLEAVARELNGRTPKKVIIVPKRIVNVVV
jgi:leucyl-tRNA synthetase